MVFSNMKPRGIFNQLKSLGLIKMIDELIRISFHKYPLFNCDGYFAILETKLNYQTKKILKKQE